MGRPSGLIETLPKPIQRRIKYLRDLQDEYDATEEEYQKELDELDRKYAALYGGFFRSNMRLDRCIGNCLLDT